MPDHPERPKKKKHRLRRILTLAAAVGGAVAYRNKKLAANDSRPPLP